MFELHLRPFIQGYGLNAGLIVAIGMQSVFLLRQGLKRRYLFVIACTCTLSDAILIASGVAGIGGLISRTALLTVGATLGGALFLILYGCHSFRSATSTSVFEINSTDRQLTTVYHTVAAALAITFLNPHVYLDTVVIIGGVGSHYPASERIWFGLGAVLASATWFFCLIYGASGLAPLLQQSAMRRRFDMLTGCLMWFIAISLIWETFHQ